MQIGINLSVKKVSPNCVASPGYCSTTEILILQFLSSLRSFNAGTIDYWRFSNPKTWLRSSSLLKRFNRTSELSSLKRARNIGKIWSLVGPFSIIGHIDNKFSASAYLTYVNWSVWSLTKLGMTLLIKVFASRILPKSLSLLTAAVLTSDSVSSRN